jgi:RsiW-degrading membrane proteinase PrsW (M82 family)
MNNLLRLIAVGGLVASAVLIVAFGMARNTSDFLAPVHLLLFVIAVALYLLPTALAFYRNCKAALWIGVVNVFLGWTLFGWVVAMGWAASGETRTLPPTIQTPPKHALQGH